MKLNNNNLYFLELWIVFFRCVFGFSGRSRTFLRPVGTKSRYQLKNHNSREAPSLTFSDCIRLVSLSSDKSIGFAKMNPNVSRIPCPLKNEYYVMRHGESIPNVLGIILSDPQKGINFNNQIVYFFFVTTDRIV